MSVWPEVSRAGSREGKMVMQGKTETHGKNPELRRLLELTSVSCRFQSRGHGWWVGWHHAPPPRTPGSKRRNAGSWENVESGRPHSHSQRARTSACGFGTNSQPQPRVIKQREYYEKEFEGSSSDTVQTHHSVHLTGIPNILLRNMYI